MADHIIRKISRFGAGYWVVDLNDVRHIFAAATPSRGANFDEQADDALRTIEDVVCEQGARGSIVHQAVFLADMSHADRCQQLMREFYGRDLPATSYIPQPPGAGRLLAIEALGVGQGCGEVVIERISDELVIARHNGIAWVHCTTKLPQGGDRPIYEEALEAMRQVCRRLGGGNVRFGQVVRTWFYLGGIVDRDDPRQRYQEFNRARTDFYRPIRFKYGPREYGGQSAYPASTGIGTAGRGVMMSAIAMVTDRGDIRAVPLEDPAQTPACDYAADCCPQTPKFCRAMVLSCGTFATTFISGTASIRGERTRHRDDPIGQTEETLDNIAALIGEENFARNGLPGLGSSLAGMALARVYIKRPQDYAAVRAMCERRLGDVPTIYAIADICRSELLVEIEGVAFSRLAGAK